LTRARVRVAFLALRRSPGYGAIVRIPVPLEALRAALAERGGNAYVLTVSDDMRAHVVHAAVHWESDLLAVEVGKRSAANATARSSVSLLYPVRSADDYSLIIDGTVTVAPRGDGKCLLITPTKAVLHRAAVTPDPAAPCSADCVPLLRR
jgi:hypothetical protein